jgi:hypothetical protein
MTKVRSVQPRVSWSTAARLADGASAASGLIAPAVGETLFDHAGRCQSSRVRPPGRVRRMGLEIEFEYEDTQDGVWSAAREPDRLRTWLKRRRSAQPQTGSNPLILHAGIALAAAVLGAASMAGFLHGRTAANDRGVSLLHLAPVNPFVVQPLPAPPPILAQNVEQFLATPWTDTFDQNVSLSVINDGPDPVTVLGATLSALDFQATELTPASPAPTAPGAVSLLRGRAHFVCGDYPPGRVATVAQLSVRTADGAVRREPLVVDHDSQIAEQAVCAQMPVPEFVPSTTFAPSHESGTYIAEVTAANRAPFPLRVTLSQSGGEFWTSTGGLDVSVPNDTVIPPHGSGTVAISVTVTECSLAQEAASNDYASDTLAFSDARDAPGSPQARMTDAAFALADLNSVMAYCGDGDPTPGGG